MIDACDPKDDHKDNELLVELVSTLQEMESKLHRFMKHLSYNKLLRLIGELEDEDMMSFTLTLNDDLTATL